DGQFGAVHDMSLVSSTGISTSGTPVSSELGFGHVADLSLVSTSSATAELEGVTEARQKLLENLDDETEANVRTDAPAGGPGAGNTLSLDPVAGRSPSPLMG